MIWDPQHDRDMKPVYMGNRIGPLGTRPPILIQPLVHLLEYITNQGYKWYRVRATSEEETPFPLTSSIQIYEYNLQYYKLTASDKFRYVDKQIMRRFPSCAIWTLLQTP